jgi:hypothetical protein
MFDTALETWVFISFSSKCCVLAHTRAEHDMASPRNQTTIETENGRKKKRKGAKALRREGEKPSD